MRWCTVHSEVKAMDGKSTDSFDKAKYTKDIKVREEVDNEDMERNLTLTRKLLGDQLYCFTENGKFTEV